MAGEPVQNDSDIVALLCVGDSADGGNIALTSVFGRPFIHHIVKKLEALGIRRFFIGIDSVPGSLLSYGDEAKREGLDVQFIRSPGDMAAQLAPDTRILVQMADIVWDNALVKKAIAERKPLVAAVEERSENLGFERIDLNHRWAGLAVLPSNSVEALTSMPDGWDMGSSLLRRALQDGLQLWQVRQAELQAGAVRLISANDNSVGLATAAGLTLASAPNSLEKWIIDPIIDRLLPRSWASPWVRKAIEWTFPLTAFGAAGLNWFGFSVGATIAGLGAIFAAIWRKRVWRAEYRSGKGDWAGLTAWLALVLTLGLALYNSYETPTESVFLTLTVVGVGIVAGSTKYRLISPLVLALTLLWGQVAGLAGPAVRLLIVAQLALLAVSALRSLKQADQP